MNEQSEKSNKEKIYPIPDFLSREKYMEQKNKEKDLKLIIVFGIVIILVLCIKEKIKLWAKEKRVM